MLWYGPIWVAFAPCFRKIVRIQLYERMWVALNLHFHKSMFVPPQKKNATFLRIACQIYSSLDWWYYATIRTTNSRFHGNLKMCPRTLLR